MKKTILPLFLSAITLNLFFCTTQALAGGCDPAKKQFYRYNPQYESSGASTDDFTPADGVYDVMMDDRVATYHSVFHPNRPYDNSPIRINGFTNYVSMSCSVTPSGTTCEKVTDEKLAHQMADALRKVGVAPIITGTTELYQASGVHCFSEQLGSQITDLDCELIAVWKDTCK